MIRPAVKVGDLIKGIAGPHRPGGSEEHLDVAKAVADLGFFKENDLRLIERENAVRLLPRLKASTI